MNWYYIIGPAHTNIRVFMNGAKCGDLCFRNEEFEQIRKDAPTTLITFFNQSERFSLNKIDNVKTNSPSSP